MKSVQTDTRRGRREGGCRVCRLSQGVKGGKEGVMCEEGADTEGVGFSVS